MSANWDSLENILKRTPDISSYWMHRYVAQASFIEKLSELHSDAEEAEGLILRLVEYAGKNTRATVRFGSKLSGAPTEAIEVDLIERPLETSSAKLDGDAVPVDIPAHGIANVLVKTGKFVGY